MKKAKTPAPADEIAQVTLISIEALEVWSGNARKGTDEGLEELADSIRAQGILQPILVRRTNNETRAAYEIVCGKRRLNAARMAGIEMIPCYLRQMDDAQAAAAVATENIHREDFTPWDAYLAVDHALQLHKTTEAAALALGKPVAWTRRVASLGSLEGIWCKTAKDNPEISLAFLERVARLPGAVQKDIWDAHHGNFKEGGDEEIVEDHEYDALTSIKLLHWLNENPICENCASRTDVQNELFPEFDKDPQCVNPECRERMRLAYVETQKAKAAKLAKTEVAKVLTTDRKRWDDADKKTKSNTVPVVITDGGCTGSIIWRKPDTPGGETSDATPKGPTPAQRMAAKYIRDIEKQIRDGLLQTWVMDASDQAQIAALLVFGCPPTSGATQINDTYEEAMNRKPNVTEEAIADGILNRVLSCLRFNTVSDCDQAYTNAKEIAEIFGAKQPETN